MSLNNSDLAKFNTIAQQMRVPEVKYRLDASEDLDQSISDFLHALAKETAVHGKGVFKYLLECMPGRALPPRLVNTAFIVDRIFDVWLRKFVLETAMAHLVDRFRYPLFILLYDDVENSVRLDLVALVDRIAASVVGWSPFPERSQNLYLAPLERLLGDLHGDGETLAVSLPHIAARWQSFVDNQENKVSKLVTRLIQREHQQARLAASDVQAQRLINRIFSNKLVPPHLQHFLENYWVRVLSLSINSETDKEDTASYKELTKQLAAVFSRKGEIAFKYAGTLIDDLCEAIGQWNIEGAESDLHALNDLIVEILKKKQLPDEALFKSLETYTEPTSSVNSAVTKLPEKGRWYIENTSKGKRLTIAAVFEDENQVLLINYLGMKYDLVEVSAFDRLLKNKKLKPLDFSKTLESVFKTTVSSLLKVAMNQKEARLKAAEKARREAETLLQAQQKAEENAQQRAREIAERTERIKLKKAERQRLERETAILEVLSGLKLGAWIAILQAEEKKRYKLVVKFSATKRYVFVDKMGIKKVDITEVDLVQQIMDEKIEILSDGAEFEDSLDRVISRIRIGK